MIQTNFIYEGQIITLQFNKNEVMKEIFKKFEVKSNIKRSINFSYIKEINEEIIGYNRK